MGLLSGALHGITHPGDALKSGSSFILNHGPNRLLGELPGGKAIGGLVGGLGGQILGSLSDGSGNKSAEIPGMLYVSQPCTSTLFYKNLTQIPDPLDTGGLGINPNHTPKMITTTDILLPSAPAYLPQAIKNDIAKISDAHGTFMPCVGFCLPAEAIVSKAEAHTKIPAGQLQSAAIMNSGILTSIVIYHDDKNGIGGLQQYFGNATGAMIGFEGNYKESYFKIPYGDYLVRMLTIQAEDSSLLAIRFISFKGQDSGWIGNVNHPQAQICIYEYSVQTSSGIEYYPLYAFDGWTLNGADKVGPIVALSARITFPYDIVIHREQGDEPVFADGDIQQRSISYKNQSKSTQTFTFEDKIRTTESHTLSTTTTDSDTHSTTRSIAATALIESVAISASQSTTDTQMHSVSTTDSTTVSLSFNKYYQFPISVAAGESVAISAEVTERRVTFNMDLNIQWKTTADVNTLKMINVPAPTSIHAVYSGTHEIKINLSAAPVS